MALPSMPSSWASRKSFQDAMVRRREAENDHRDRWRNNSLYFQRAAVACDKQNSWTSEESFKGSMKAFAKKTQSEEKMIALEKRRERLGELLGQERRLYEEELKAITPGNRETIQEIREKIAELRTTREDTRRKEADEKFYQHFLNNNPDLRKVRRDTDQKKMVVAWEDQIEEAKMKREEEAALKAREEEEAQRMRKEEENEERRRLEMKRITEERAKAALQMQVQELQNRERVSRRLKEEEENLLRQGFLIADLKQQREAQESLRREREYRKALIRQHKAVLRRRAQDVQEELEQDMAILKTLAEQEATERHVVSSRREKAVADVAWMRRVLEDQMRLEQQRNIELEAMYQEEAARVWRKRDAEWERERLARQRLMQEVFDERENQLREKMTAVRQEREEALRRREEALAEVEIANKMAKEEEEDLRAMKQKSRRDMESQRDAKVERLALERLHLREEEQEERRRAREYDEMIARETDRFRRDEGTLESPTVSDRSVASKSSLRSNPPWATYEDTDDSHQMRRKSAWT